MQQYISFFTFASSHCCCFGNAKDIVNNYNKQFMQFWFHVMAGTWFAYRPNRTLFAKLNHISMKTYFKRILYLETLSKLFTNNCSVPMTFCRMCALLNFERRAETTIVALHCIVLGAVCSKGGNWLQHNRWLGKYQYFNFNYCY